MQNPGLAINILMALCLPFQSGDSAKTHSEDVKSVARAAQIRITIANHQSALRQAKPSAERCYRV